MNRLDEIAARLEAATPGPWDAYGTTVAAMTGPGECWGCSGLPSPAHEPACLWSETAGADEPDAELIAHAPADLSRIGRSGVGRRDTASPPYSRRSRAW